MTTLFGTNAQAPQLRQVPLQPAGIPGSTFVRPQEVQTGGNLKALADALGGLNSALQNYGNVTARQEEDPQSRANREWIAKRQQMSIEDLRKEAAAGTADGVRVREDALFSLLGERANDDFRKRWTEFYNTEFDRTSGDASAEYERLRQEYASGLPNDLAKGNFYRLTKDHYSAWMQKDTEQKVEVAKQNIGTTIMDGFRNSIDDARGIHGKDETAAANIIFQKSAANRDFIGLSGQEQNDAIFELAREYALKGDEKMARALLEGERVGSDGKPLPALTKSSAYASKGLQLLEQAGAQRDQVWSKENLDAQVADNELIDRGAFNKAEADKRRGQAGYPDDKLARMVAQSAANLQSTQYKAAAEKERRDRRISSERQEHAVIGQAYVKMQTLGGINDLDDVEIDAPSDEGKTTLSRSRIIERATARFQSQMADEQETLIAQGVPEADAKRQIRGRKLTFYSVNRIANREWSDVLNGIAGRASTEGLLERGDNVKKLVEDAELYRELKAANPAYLSTLLSDAKSKDFLESYLNSVENRKLPPEEALHSAAVWASQDERTKAGNIISKPDAEKMAERLLKGIGADMRGPALVHVLQRIQDISSNGATIDETRDLLEKELEDTTVVINGVMVQDNNDLPDDFPELVEKQLASSVPMLKSRGIEDVEDLFIVPVSGQSKWAVYSKKLGFANTGIYITPQSLRAERAGIVRGQEELTRKLIAAADKERAEYKKLYDEDVARQKANIARFSKRKGFLSQAIARKLQDNLDGRISADQMKLEAELRQAVRDYRTKQDEASKRRMEFLRSLVPDVRVGGDRIIDGWRIR